jgi:hypothetical protein
LRGLLLSLIQSFLLFRFAAAQNNGHQRSRKRNLPRCSGCIEFPHGNSLQACKFKATEPRPGSGENKVSN